jgi:YD repeat-containing protein
MTLQCDNAANLTKDADGYEYEYDAESRIIRVTDGKNDVAEFGYDALGRRIRTTDSKQVVNRRHFHGKAGSRYEQIGR